MKLHEFEGKDIVKKHGLAVPDSTLVKNIDELHNPHDMNKRVVKAQLLTVKSRAKTGAVKICSSFEDVRSTTHHLLRTPVEGELAPCVLLEEEVQTTNEYYLAITYDTSKRMPVILFNRAGGIDIESSSRTQRMHVNPMHGIHDWMARDLVKRAGVPQDKILKMADIIKKAYNCFAAEDCKLLEINPLTETGDGRFVAVDVAIELDGDAGFRHKDRSFAERSTKPLTEREAAVKKANAVDYRGTIKYIELDGDIGFLAAGGGGSLTCMDALAKYGGRPSNYTEYSGNPSADKVYELTKQIISKPGLRGLWIVGAIANFTRVDTTMEGITRALVEMKPEFPIVVRRSGPYEKEGLEVLRKAAQEHGLDMRIHGKEMPMTESARLMVDASRKFGG